MRSALARARVAGATPTRSPASATCARSSASSPTCSASSKRYGHPFAVLLMDIDGLKRINDAHGHPAGDRVLMQVAMSLRRSIRTVDTAARIGGDEFCVLAARAGPDRAPRSWPSGSPPRSRRRSPRPASRRSAVSIGVVAVAGARRRGRGADRHRRPRDVPRQGGRASGESPLGEAPGEHGHEGATACEQLARRDGDEPRRQRYSIRPWRMPIATACVRVEASSFARMRLVCVRTVSVERPSCCGDRVGLHPVGEHLEDLALAGAERAVALVEHDRRGQARVDVELAVARGLDRAHQVLRGRVLADVALDAGLERLAEQARAAVGGEDHDRRVHLLLETADDLAHVDAGAPRVDDHHVGRVAVRASRRPGRSIGVGDLDLVEGLLEDGADSRTYDRMVIHDQAARRALRAGGHCGQHTSNSRPIPGAEERPGRACGDSYGRGSRRSSSRVTAPATLTHAAAATARRGVRTAAPTRVLRRAAAGARLGGRGAPAAARARGFALVRAAFGGARRLRRGPAARPRPSPRPARPAAPSRFALRLPGRERGRFPSTPSVVRHGTVILVAARFWVHAESV